MDKARAQETDTRLMELYVRQAELSAQVARITSQLHAGAGNRRDFRQSGHPWKMPFGSVIRIAQERPALQPLLAERQGLLTEITRCHERERELDKIYQAAPWSRFFVVTSSSDGHIHSSMSCSTCYLSTTFGWHPELSGLKVAEAVAKLGPYLCQVCFPAAKAEWKRDRSEARRAEAMVSRAARQEARYVKQLRPEEQFRGYNGDKVTTVAGCQKALRDEVEFRDYYGGGEHSFHAASMVAAQRAREILLARDADHGGLTAEQISQLIKRAEARCRKYGARP